MRNYLIGLTAGAVVGLTPIAVRADEGVPRLDHVFVIVLENHNSFASFGSNGILDNPKSPHLQDLARTYNFAANYHGAWHPSLPNYLAMITGDFVGTDVLGRPGYPAGSTVGISDDDSPTVATDYPSPPANLSNHRWTVSLPSLAGQLVAAGKDWRAYLQNIPATGTTLANWPGDSNTAKLYAVKHNPFPYVAEVQNDQTQFARQVPIEQLFGDLGAGTVPAFSYIVPDQCRDMHGIGNVLAPCGGVDDTDDNDVSRGDDEAFWLVNGITGSRAWTRGRNAICVVSDEGNGPYPCAYQPGNGMDLAPGTLAPGANCYNPANFNDKLVMIVITSYGVRGRMDPHFYNHYSLLKTVEAAFGLPYLGHAADATTHTLAPLLQPED